MSEPDFGSWEIVMKRRHFLTTSVCLLGTIQSAWAFWPFKDKESDSSKNRAGKIFDKDAPARIWKWSHEAMFYQKTAQGGVLCELCPHGCFLNPGDRGICRNRVNHDGTLYTLAYGNPCAVHIDPIEKKPLFHFKPHSQAFSIATTGCNFRCLNCQNWQISQAKPSQVRHEELFPTQVVEQAKKYNVSSLAYTYSEPISFYEYMSDTATLAHQQGLSNVLISNGYIRKTPLVRLSSLLDAANINLKAFDDTIYQKLNGGRLQPVLETFKTLHELGVYFEMTNLVVPGYVDDPEMVKRMCDWILKNLGPQYPLHFLRFYPQYKLDRLAPTPVSTLVRFWEMARKEGIYYVYIGNAPVQEAMNTYCHHCKRLLIERRGYQIPVNRIVNGRCQFCQTRIPGIW
jgi:pyruvate formate lyase activating enzyme